MGFNNFDKCTKVAISIPFAISYDILPRIDGHGGDDEGGVAEELTVLIAGDEFPLPLGVGPSIAEDDARVVLGHFPADDDHLGAAGSRRTRPWQKVMNVVVRFFVRVTVLDHEGLFR